MREAFWLQDGTALYTSWTIFPHGSMTEEQKLNCLSRLVLVVGGALFLFNIGNWWLFILMGLGLIVATWFVNCFPVPQRIRKKSD